MIFTIGRYTMKLSEITKVSELFEIIDWDFDGNGLTVTDGELLAEAIAVTFPELEDDMLPLDNQ